MSLMEQGKSMKWVLSKYPPHCEDYLSDYVCYWPDALKAAKWAGKPVKNPKWLQMMTAFHAQGQLEKRAIERFRFETMRDKKLM